MMDFDRLFSRAHSSCHDEKTVLYRAKNVPIDYLENFGISLLDIEDKNENELKRLLNDPIREQGILVVHVLLYVHSVVSINIRYDDWHNFDGNYAAGYLLKQSEQEIPYGYTQKFFVIEYTLPYYKNVLDIEKYRERTGENLLPLHDENDDFIYNIKFELDKGISFFYLKQQIENILGDDRKLNDYSHTRNRLSNFYYSSEVIDSVGLINVMYDFYVNVIFLKTNYKSDIKKLKLLWPSLMENVTKTPETSVSVRYTKLMHDLITVDSNFKEKFYDTIK